MNIYTLLMIIKSALHLKPKKNYKEEFIQNNIAKAQFNTLEMNKKSEHKNITNRKKALKDVQSRFNKPF